MTKARLNGDDTLTNKPATSSVLHTSLGKSMAFFLAFICLAVLIINSWTLWNSWQQALSQSKSQARNLSVSLARQAEDTFLQADITLSDIAREISVRGDAIVALPEFSQQLAKRSKLLPQLHGLFV